MTLAVPGVSRAHRPFPVVIISVLLLVLGIGGGAMLFGFGGEIMLPDEYLDMLPLVDSWVIPGLLLGVGFGLGSLVMLYGVLRRPDWQWLHWLERSTRHHWSWWAPLPSGWGTWPGSRSSWPRSHSRSSFPRSGLSGWHSLCSLGCLR